MHIEAGKFYRTRDGRKVGPMVVVTVGYDPSYPFTVDHHFATDIGKAWRGDGTFGVGCEDHPADLIAEWTDPGPVRTVTRKEIVPGTYGPVEIASLGRASVTVEVCIENMMTAAELREAARIFTELADALEPEAE